MTETTTTRVDRDTLPDCPAGMSTVAFDKKLDDARDLAGELLALDCVRDLDLECTSAGQLTGRVELLSPASFDPLNEMLTAHDLVLGHIYSYETFVDAETDAEPAVARADGWPDRTTATVIRVGIRRERCVADRTPNRASDL